jgi:1-acyl-sn-glycerol-3-phosphate acyltransferase
MKFKFTLRNVIFVINLLILGLLTPIVLVPALLAYLVRAHKFADRYTNAMSSFYARQMLFVGGAKVKIHGLQNLPASNRLCFVSNHQGLADIPLIVGFIPKTIGFIAKKELGRVPFLNVWMRAMHCLLIDRKNIRQSLTIIERGSLQIQQGHPMVIFPEGTRSRSRRMGTFKPGAFKLVIGANAIAVPLTIDGTYKIVEATGKITPVTVQLTIHSPVDVSTLSEEQKKTLHSDFAQIIASALK